MTQSAEKGPRVPEFDLLHARLEEYEQAWGWHEADEINREGFGPHMAQMLYRLPRDGQTDDMRASIGQMLADLDRALYKLSFLQDAFEAAFQPDFGGVDWRDDAAIQQFARAATATLYTRVTPPVECDNYLPPLTCLTAPSSESGRCDKCAERGQADA